MVWPSPFLIHMFFMSDEFLFSFSNLVTCTLLINFLPSLGYCILKVRFSWPHDSVGVHMHVWTPSDFVILVSIYCPNSW
eukprot:c24001_g2_i5 orf=436-672(-)